MSKVVIVNYRINDAFKIPKGLDLEDKTQVKNWGVKYNVLHIYKVDGTELEIESEGWIHSFDYKYPSCNDVEIENASDWGIDDDDNEEEEENDKEQEEQDDFTERMCEYCHKEFDLTDPHHYDEEKGICYCSEECYDKMEQEDNEEESDKKESEQDGV
jgi:hypothetical protein